jgi:hypothetical protein
LQVRSVSSVNARRREIGTTTFRGTADFYFFVSLDLDLFLQHRRTRSAGDGACGGPWLPDGSGRLPDAASAPDASLGGPPSSFRRPWRDPED